MLLLLACATPPADTPKPVDDTDIPVVDADEDGFLSDEDCDDADATVFPGALETIGDASDANCDDDPDVSPVTSLPTLVGPKHGLAAGANRRDVFLHVQLDEWVNPDGNPNVAAAWIGKYDDDADTFDTYWWTGFWDTGAADAPRFTAKPDFYVDNVQLLWANTYVDAGERNVQGMVLTHGTMTSSGTRIVSWTDHGFGDVDLLALDDGTFMVAGCDPTNGELVVMHGTAGEFFNTEVPFDYESAWAADSCSVSALTGSLVVADASEEIFDIYGYSDDDGLSYLVGWPGLTGYDLDSLVLESGQWMADAEGPAGLRLVTPDGEVWWEGADAREVDLVANDDGDVLVGLLDADGVPWLVWGNGTVGASLGATFPHADDLAVTYTPDGDVFVAISEGDLVSWARWRLAE